MNERKQIIERKNIALFIVQLFLNLIMLGLPLIVTDGYYNITETKSVYFYVLATVTVLAVSVYRFFSTERKKAFKPKLNVTDIAVLIFGAVYFLSAVISEYQTDVWTGGNSRYQGAVTVLLYVAVYFTVSRSYRSSAGFLLCSLATFFAVSVVGVLNCYDIDIFGFYGSILPKYKSAYISTIGNVNFYSAYFSLLFPVMICGFCQSEGRRSRVLYIISLIIGAFGMMVTSSESFVAGFVFAMAVLPLFFSDSKKLERYIEAVVIIVLSMQIYLILYNNADKKNIELSRLFSLAAKPVVTVGIILLCAVFCCLLIKKPQIIPLCRKVYVVLFTFALAAVALCFLLSNTAGLGALDEFFRIDDSWGTYRGEIWKQCIEVYKDFSFKEKLFGTGPEALYRIVEASEVHGERTLDQAHNEYLQYLMTIGIFGLLSYLSVIVAVIVSVVRRLKDNSLAVGLLAGLIAYWIQASVNIAQPFTTPIMYVFIACIGGMLYNERNRLKVF